MEITDIRIKKIEKEDSKIKAIATITIDGCFVIHDIKVVSKDDGFIISMPSKKLASGGFADIAHPITKEARENLNALVVEAYNKALAE